MPCLPPRSSRSLGRLRTDVGSQDADLDVLFAGDLPPAGTVLPADAVPRSPRSLTRRVAGGPAPDQPILQITGLAKSYGGALAVRGVVLSVTCGEILGIIGPNGAGKTTVFEMWRGS